MSKPTETTNGTGMRMDLIRCMPTAMDDPGKVHESVFRSYHVLEKTKNMLERGVPASFILELIREMECRGSND